MHAFVTQIEQLYAKTAKSARIIGAMDVSRITQKMQRESRCLRAIYQTAHGQPHTNGKKHTKSYRMSEYEVRMEITNTDQTTFIPYIYTMQY